MPDGDLTLSDSRELIDYQVNDGIAVLTLNDPPANTYSY